METLNVTLMDRKTKIFPIIVHPIFGALTKMRVMTVTIHHFMMILALSIVN